jgi:hypothetical protein
VKDVERVLVTNGLSFITSELIHENVPTTVTSVHGLSPIIRISDVIFLYTQIPVHITVQYVIQDLGVRITWSDT